MARLSRSTCVSSSKYPVSRGPGRACRCAEKISVRPSRDNVGVKSAKRVLITGPTFSGADHSSFGLRG